MNKKASIAGLSIIACLGFNSAVLGAEEPVSLQNAVVAHNSPTDDNDLLMFFEEQDLVTATKRPTTLRKAPAIAAIITANEIRNMGALNLLDVLKMVPGFGISINEIGLNMIEVRGIRTFVSEKILVMIDGHSLNKNITGSTFYSFAEMIPMENIRQVEVVRGPGSALYGNSAFVATINIITRNAEEINGMEIKAGGGSFDSFKGNLVGGRAIGEKLTLSGSVDHYQTKGPKLRVESDFLSGNSPSFPFPTAPYSMAPGTPGLNFKQTDAFLKIGYGDLTFRGGYKTIRKDFFIGFGPALTDNNFTNIDTYWGELDYGLHLNEGLSANLKLYYDHYEQDPNVKIYPNGFAGVFPDGMIGKPLVKDRTMGGEIQVDWDISTENHLIAGFSFEVLQQYDVRQQANFDPLTGLPLGSVQDVANWNKDADRQIFATYLQDEWQIVEQLNLTTGLRYDHYSDFGDTFNPRIGLVWSFLENADLKLLYGQAFRAPNFQELYNINNPAQKGDSKLKPERITTYEAGLAWRLNRIFAANLNYFHSTIDDQIDVDTTSVPPTYANKFKSETQGLEMGVNGTYENNLYWKLSYAWQDPRNAITGERLAYVPSHRASGSVNYAPVKFLNLHTDVLWTGPRPREKGDSRPEMPDYTTVDLAVTLKNFFNTLEIQATIRNLFDQRYKDPDTSGAQIKIPGDFPREGISGFVTASYKF